MTMGLSAWWIYAIQIVLIVHVLRTGRSRNWVLLLIFIPLLSAIAYLVLELLPEWSGSIRGQRARRGLAGTLNPGGRLRQLQLAWEQTPNADNARHLATALIAAGRFDEAAPVLDQALSGLFATEPNLMLLQAQLAFEQGEPARAVETLDRLQAANPDFRSAEGHLLLARALEAAGQMPRALDEYRAVSTYFPGVEARFRLALALRTAGQEAASRSEIEQILADARLAPGHFRRAQAGWLRQARAALKK